MRKKLTQTQLAFYKLYTEHKLNPERFVKIWEFVGEIHLKELGEWGLMSYTCVHRVFEIFSDNPGLVERQMTKGKSGARYYEYRITPSPRVELIKDESLRSLLEKVRRNSGEAPNT